MVIYSCWVNDYSKLYSSVSKPAVVAAAKGDESLLIPIDLQGRIGDDTYFLVGEDEDQERFDSLKDAIERACEMTDWRGELSLPPIVCRSKADDAADDARMLESDIRDALEQEVQDLSAEVKRLKEENRRLEKELYPNQDVKPADWNEELCGPWECRPDEMPF